MFYKLIFILIFLFNVSPVIANEYDYESEGIIGGEYLEENGYESPVLGFQRTIDNMEFKKYIREERRRQEYNLYPYGRSNSYYKGNKNERQTN